MNNLRGKLTYANVISTIALFLVLAGGTAFAANEALLPKNSVGAKQLKPGAVTPAKLSAASMTALAGPTGPQGATGPKGDRGNLGAQGPEGLAGTTGNEPLLVDASGETPSPVTNSSVPLTGTTSWTATEGRAGLLFGKITTTLGAKVSGYPCTGSITVLDNGTAVGSFGFYVGQTGANERSEALAPKAIAIHEPGIHTITATVYENGECNATSKIDSLYLMVAPVGR